MINRNRNAILAGSVAAALLSSNTVFAAGFEKSVLWSGKYAGQGNAAVSSASGAEALYFNPAGLAGAAGTQLSLNVSPTFSTFSGPVATANESVEGVQTTSPIFGALASYAITDKLGFGIGAYVAGGAKAKFENVAIAAPFTIELSPQTDLSAIEYSAGLGYEVMPGLRLGAAVRYTQVKTALTSASQSGSGGATTVSEAEITDLTDAQFGGYRLGANYTGSNWGLGVNYRSAVDFSAEGSATIRYEVAAAAGTINDVAAFDATVASTLPAQLSVGGHYNLSESLRLAAEYVWTNYKAVDTLDISGGTAPFALSDLTLNFSDQTNVRLGASYAMNPEWTFRAGYVYTSQVTPASLARPTLTPPGVAHSVTAGAGYALSANMDLNLAGEYATASGTGTGNTTAQTKAGDFEATGYMIHTGITYRM